MKKIGIFLLLVLFGAGTYAFYYPKNIDPEASIESPLPQLLTKSFPVALAEINSWFPSSDVLGESTDDIEVAAAAAASYDLGANKFIYQNNTNVRLPIASLTKIMTAIIALENIPQDKKIIVSKNAATIGEGTMGLVEGEGLILEDLLYGLMLQSGNDAGEAIAEGSQFGRDNFVYLMNKKAEDLGLTDTHFTNPTGLEGDGDQYSTISDLIVITRYALQNDTFARIVSTYQHNIAANSDHKQFTLYNETNLLTSYPGVRGVKTGYTDEAGMCLVTYLDYGGHKIIAVILNASNRRQEMKDILDYSLKSIGVRPPPHS